MTDNYFSPEKMTGPENFQDAHKEMLLKSQAVGKSSRIEDNEKDFADLEIELDLAEKEFERA